VAKSGVVLGENGSVIPRPKGKPEKEERPEAKSLTVLSGSGDVLIVG
jgi:hypothetical protein